MKPYEAIASKVIYLDGRLVCKRTGNYRDTSRMSSGYAACKCGISGKVYRDSAHRVVWFIHNGIIPEGMEIDHINRDRLDNRIENLRLVSRAGNCHNTNSLGVYFDSKTSKWYSNICIKGFQKRLGSWDNPIDARAAYLAAKTEINLTLN